MGSGLKVWNADGSLLFDVSSRLTKVVGVATIPAGSSGSATVGAPIDGAIWYAHLPTNGSWYLPIVTVSGRTISWSPSTLFTPTVVTLIYGVY